MTDTNYIPASIFVHAGEMVLVQLLNWIRWHFSSGREMAQEVLTEESPEEHPAYWESVSLVRLYCVLL